MNKNWRKSTNPLWNFVSNNPHYDYNIIKDLFDKCASEKEGGDSNMKVYLGESGLDKSWQLSFSKTTKCYKCGGEARIMFVAVEEDEPRGQYVCDLRNNGGEGDYWVHDAIACAVYLCADCFESIAILNQA